MNAARQFVLESITRSHVNKKWVPGMEMNAPSYHF